MIVPGMAGRILFQSEFWSKMISLSSRLSFLFLF